MQLPDDPYTVRPDPLALEGVLAEAFIADAVIHPHYAGHRSWSSAVLVGRLPAVPDRDLEAQGRSTVGRLSRTLFNGHPTRVGSVSVADAAVGGQPGIDVTARVAYAVARTAQPLRRGHRPAGRARRRVGRGRGQIGPRRRPGRPRPSRPPRRWPAGRRVAAEPRPPGWRRPRRRAWPGPHRSRSPPGPGPAARRSRRPAGPGSGFAYGDQGGRRVEQHDVADRSGPPGHQVADDLGVGWGVAADQIGEFGALDAELGRVELGPGHDAVGVDPHRRRRRRGQFVETVAAVHDQALVAPCRRRRRPSARPSARSATPTAWAIGWAGLVSGPRKLNVVGMPISLRTGPACRSAGWYCLANRKPMPTSSTTRTCAPGGSARGPARGLRGRRPPRRPRRRPGCRA